jgi:tetratricopeptide (TPR) repeat protein
VEAPPGRVLTPGSALWQFDPIHPSQPTLHPKVRRFIGKLNLLRVVARILETEREGSMLSTIRLTLLMAAAAALFAQDRFDMTVRDDFFAGFAGNRAALGRGMKKCEEILAANPKDAEAMVWHGSGIFFESGQAAQKQDYPQAAELYKRGLDEMAAAVALAPESVAVVIPRGATLLTASHFIPGDNGKELLKTGLADYEKVYQLQRSYFDTLPGHASGELLFGLAEGYQRMGDEARAREWFQKLASITDPENGHLKQAKDYLQSGKLNGPVTCVGCHAGK